MTRTPGPRRRPEEVTAERSPEIEPGDYVTIAHEKGALTWFVLKIEASFRPIAILESGQSTKRRREWVDRLTLFKKGQ